GSWTASASCSTRSSGSCARDVTRCWPWSGSTRRWAEAGRTVMDTLAPRDPVRVTLGVSFVAGLIVTSFWVLQPFLPAALWAVTIVIATWPSHAARGVDAVGPSGTGCGRDDLAHAARLHRAAHPGALDDRDPRARHRRLGGVARDVGDVVASALACPRAHRRPAAGREVERCRRRASGGDRRPARAVHPTRHRLGPA